MKGAKWAQLRSAREKQPNDREFVRSCRLRCMVMIKHAGSRAYTRVRAGSRGYTRVGAGTRAYTRVHARTCPNAQFDAFSAQMDREMDKIRHRRRRGFGRVDDRTRGFTRVRAGARAYVS